jgi:hypothetical protein
VVGAASIGDTDLEETMENLIQNRLRVPRSGYGDASNNPEQATPYFHLLNPEIDLEDFFD